MRSAHIYFLYPADKSELLPGDINAARLAIEAATSVALLELCGCVLMQNVWIEDENEDLSELSPDDQQS